MQKKSSICLCVFFCGRVRGYVSLGYTSATYIQTVVDLPGPGLSISKWPRGWGATYVRRPARPPARRIGDSVVSSRPCTYACGCNRPCPACLHLIPNAIWEHTRAVRPHSHHHTRHTVNRQLKLNFASEFFRVSTYVLYNFFVVIKFFMWNFLESQKIILTLLISKFKFT
jgi:hypothetical protein